MKNVIKLFLIIYLFFVSLNTNTFAANLHLPQNVNCIQAVDKIDSVYNGTQKFEKFIVPSTRVNESVIFSKNNNSNTAFGGFKDCLSPANHQFSLLLFYAYNKSYLIGNKQPGEKIFLTEIFPNAP